MPSRKRSREEIRRDAPSIAHSNGPGPDPNALLHEVHVHQEELNARNDELRRLRAALESATHGYADLYDLAPNGYLTLDAHGVIRQLNLAAASLIGSSRQAIQDRPLLVFVVQSDRGRLLEFLRHCRQQSEGACIAEELALAARGEPRQVQLLCRARQDERGRREYLTAMLDVTQLRRLEAERHDAASERAALAGRLIAVQEDMRKRFSRDLHDNIGQQMTALGLKLAALVAGAPDHLARELEDVYAALQELDRQLDFLATELRPAVLDAGIVTALRDFVQEWSGACGIEAGFQSLGMDADRLSPEVETHLYRVTQEALNNVYKHAQAKHVSLVLERRVSEVVLVIEDDGCGFDPGVRGRGLGLVGMRERAALVGAILELESMPAHGTTVYFRVPIRAGDVARPGRNRL